MVLNCHHSIALMLENLKSIHNICQKYLENDLEAQELL